MSTFNLAFIALIGEEGGYVNDPDDAGGETKFGISKRSYPLVDIKHLTVEEAKTIYSNDYWLPSLATKCDSRLSDFIFDTAVNMGIRASTKFVQKALGVKVDGIAGEGTLNAIQTQAFDNLTNEDCTRVLREMVLYRIAFYSALVKRKPTNRKYFFGWVNRTLRLLHEY